MESTRDEGRTVIWLSEQGAELEPTPAASLYPNAICTTRFRWYTWLPKSLFLQFQRVANVYFLLIAILVCMPWSPKSWKSKVIPFGAVLLWTAVKDLVEDLERYADDKAENTQEFRRYVCERGSFEHAQWQACQVGDLVLTKKDEVFPADILVVASSSGCSVFISTTSLDGETNLKQRFAMPLQGTMDAPSSREAAAALLGAQIGVHLQEPRASLDEMDGCLEFTGSEAGEEVETMGISVANFAPRGCVLRNTTWALGVACYVGDETKMRLNAGQCPSKVSAMQHLLNRSVVGLLLCLFLLVLCFTIASRFIGTQWDSFVILYLKYLIVLYHVVPISLYIVFEMLKLIISWQIRVDPRMRDAATGAFAKVRTADLVEEFGQVHTVFSDKTGTLTANDMRFHGCCVGGAVLRDFLEEPGGDAGLRPPGPGPGVERARGLLAAGAGSAAARAFFEALALCNTVQVDEAGAYQGESPDEVALVRAAAAVGVVLAAKRVTQAGSLLTLQCPWGPSKEHLVAHVLAFSSDRKRMSVVCPADDGGALVLTKGADNVMEGLLAQPPPPEAHAALVEFAQAGLRTLVVAKRRMDAGTYGSWKVRMDLANASLHSRSEELAAMAAEAEAGLSYLGVTALEDRLQEGVPETIGLLREAGIRIWVLTGDKVETAVEVARFCRLFEPDVRLTYAVEAASLDGAMALLKGTCAESAVPSGIVLDGCTLAHILGNAAARRALYELAAESCACVCCRLTPKQKRELVELVREADASNITLAIGDGNNDAPMIQGAHIGVGIRGKEGAAAVQASDVAISQFRFLANLTLCHGRRAYRRVATFLSYYLYKNLVLVWSDLIYANGSRFSGEIAYPEWLSSCYNSLFTSATVLLVLGYDRDYPDEVALRSPELYEPGPNDLYFNIRTFTKWVAIAAWHGILAWVVPVYTLTTREERWHRPEAFWEASLSAFTVVVLIVNGKLLLVAEKPLTTIAVAAVAFFVLLYFVIVFLFGYAPFLASLQPQLVGMPGKVFASPPDLLRILLTLCLALSVDAVDACRRRRRPGGYSVGRRASNEQAESDGSWSDNTADS